MPGYDYKALDDVIHGRVRLAIMSYLAGAHQADFNELKTTVSVSDGNLSTHLRKLEDTGYVAVDKHFENRRPVTTIRLTKAGRAAFEQYVSQLGDILGLSRGD